MASTELVRAQLNAAGFDDVGFSRTDGVVMVGSGVEQALQFQLALGPAKFSARRESTPKYVAPRSKNALRAELARYQVGGKIMMGSSSWTITARRPSA